MTHEFQASPQWELISKEWVNEDASLDLTNFKSDQRNYNISLWNPTANGIRYLKTLLYSLALNLGPLEWAKLSRINGRELGDPLTVRHRGEELCMDYLQAVLELGFIERHVELAGSRVLEIGAGYGRTCHTLLSNHDVAEYCIVDLTNTLRLSRSYLGKVLDGTQFAKLRFVDVEDIAELSGAAPFDLCINIHSFTEMTPSTVRAYLDLIDRTCRAFYVKNPVGKFIDKRLDGHFKGDDAVRIALQTGPLRQVLDIFDSQAVDAAVPGFIEAYRPGADWTCRGQGQAVPWSYFRQAVYANGRTQAATGTAGP
ncbi:putative sugar O-methyltransferase [Dactylosporangium sp. CA-092794]|uniref:putative sugar O-methyltransferase n=1 Tax=Dactylosporangium sp. CA-092794 TaxID=3239929 RepID=UPI003D8BFCCF